jgi:Tol biopolymer transport system component
MNKNKILFRFLAALTVMVLLLSGCAGGKTTSPETTSTVGTTITTVVNETLTGKIAFESYRDSGNDMITEIYLMNPDGSHQQRITPYTNGGLKDNDLDPVWSPGGSKIVFSSWMDGNINLYIVNSDGTDEKQLTSVGVDVWAAFPSWSPDGSRIAFASYRTGQAQIYIMNSDGSNQTRLTNAKETYDHQTLSFTYSNWSPDGSKILSDNGWGYFGNGTEDHGGIYVFSVDTGNNTQLTHNADDHNAVWSPDGSKIAFFRTDSSDPNGGGNIYVMNSDGSGLTKLTGGDNNPTWSPDGSKIAFTSSKGGNGKQLYTIHPDGSRETNVMSSLNNAGVNLTPSWSPDGKKLVFEYQSEIFFVNSDGSGLKKVTTGARAGSAVWSPE